MAPRVKSSFGVGGTFLFLGGFIELGKRLKLYSVILLGKTGNSLDIRFKLVGTITKYGVDDLYEGIRSDGIRKLDFLLDNILRNRDNPDRVLFMFNGDKYNAGRTVFRREPGSKHYYDVLDKNTPCMLVNRFNSRAEYGCCNVQKVKHYSRLVDVRVGERI